MNVDILVQKIDGDYSFTISGELAAYSHTTKKILAYYMAKEKALNQATIQQKLHNLQGFLSENFLEINDYLNNIDLLAQYIGENNSVALSSFFGRRFLPVLEEVKQQLLSREVSKYREHFENPLRSPSHSLLDELESLLIKSKPLIWPPPPSKENDAVTTPELSLKISSRASEYEETQIKTIDQKIPGVILLELYEKSFAKAKPLTLPLESELLHETVSKTEITTSDALPQQVSFKEYVQLSNKLSQFARNKDNQGYQLWLSQLEPRLNACTYLNQLLIKENKGQKIDWVRQISSLSDQLYIESGHVKKIKNEVCKYQSVFIKLRKLLQELPEEVRQLYSQLIILLDKKDNIKSKQAALKMTLLQVMNPSLKESLYTKVCLLIDILDQEMVCGK